MGYKYSCFISYQRQNDLVDKFVKDFRGLLSAEVNPFIGDKLDVFNDASWLMGGESFDKRLAVAMCESVCMVAVYTPTYFSQKSIYSASEYFNMERLEKERLKLLPPKQRAHGLIIPIVLRGADMMPPQIKTSRAFYDFSDYFFSDQQLSGRPEYHRQVREIAKYIADCYETLRGLPELPGGDCKSFKFSDPDEVISWMNKIGAA
jgi:TIR domain